MVLFSREALGLKISLVPGAIKLSSSCSARLKGLPRPEPLETHKSFRHTYTCTHRGIRTRAHTEDTEVFKPAAKETYSYELAKKDQQAVVKSFNFSMLAGTVNQHV